MNDVRLSGYVQQVNTSYEKEYDGQKYWIHSFIISLKRSNKNSDFPLIRVKSNQPDFDLKKSDYVILRGSIRTEYWKDIQGKKVLHNNRFYIITKEVKKISPKELSDKIKESRDMVLNSII